MTDEKRAVTYCKDCKRSIYGEYRDCDINIENHGRYVRGNDDCACKIADMREEQGNG